MDEVGRGTTALDGIAISFATLHHLYYNNRCRTLFATHFHELADMIKHFECAGCYCTDLKEDKVGVDKGWLCLVFHLRKKCQDR